MEKTAKIYVAGHNGLVGSAIVRRLQSLGYDNLLFADYKQVDLRDAVQVKAFFEANKPDYVILAAAKVGGIHANNTYPAEFIYDNLMIEANVIHQSYLSGVKRLLFLGSSCIYPKLSPQPIKEEYLLTGELEPTNEPYAIAKITGIKLCESYNRQYGTHFMSVMPTNLYGPNDNFDLANSHVLPALIRKFHEAKVAGADSVVVWGTGTPRREFLYVDDMADACIHVLTHHRGTDIVNIGTGQDLTIAELAETVKTVVGFAGKIVYDTTKPDGTLRKLLDVSRLKALGWTYKTELPEGIRLAYESYLAKLSV